MKELDTRRVCAVYLIIFTILSFLFFRLYVISQNDYTKALPSLAGQYTKKIALASRRGFVYDRSGALIAGEIAGYNTLIDPSKLNEPLIMVSEDLAAVCSDLPDDLYQRFVLGRPFVLRTGLAVGRDWAKSVPVYTHDGENADALRHLLGYTDKAGNGVSGLELAYNDFLKRTGGSVDAVYQMDALQRSFGGSPVSYVNYGYGERSGLALTIDIELQKKVAEIAARHMDKGAAVVMSASGEVLAAVSLPTYDVSRIAEYIGSANGEFVNRALAAFTPGSVFKAVTAAAALERDPSLWEFEYTCAGGIDVSGQHFTCNNSKAHGRVTMLEAGAESCNCYFIALAGKIGYEPIREMAVSLGVGASGSLDGIAAGRGSIAENASPPPAFTANAAIGQGGLLATPLECARIFACIASGGMLPAPTLVKSFIFAGHENATAPVMPVRVFSEHTAKKLTEMTAACVAGGTGTAAATAFYAAAGKTSSAQSGQYTEKGGERVQVVHSWFCGFYPVGAPGYAKPLYSVAVIVEGGVTDDIRAAPVFAEICNYLGQFLREGWGMRVLFLRKSTKKA